MIYLDFKVQTFVLKCFSQVDEVMLTMKQAFSTAAALQSSKNQIKLCEACPMHDLHKLCERIEGTTPTKLTQCTYPVLEKKFSLFLSMFQACILPEQN